MTATVPCPGCGAPVPDEEGPEHAYIGASPGCWRRYGELLAEQAPGDAPAARLAVDAYAARHPGADERRARQSVAIHLMSMCLMLERAWPPDAATRAADRLLQGRPDRPWLTPPPPGPITIADVLEAAPSERGQRTIAWARAVWEDWAAHHATVRAWLDEAGF